MTDEEIDAIIGRILMGGLQRETPRQKIELQRLAIEALFVIIQRKIKMTATTNGVERSIGIEGLIDLLIPAGVDVDVTQPLLGTLLIQAIVSNQLVLAKKLIPYTRKNINATCKDTGNTALICAAASGNLSLVDCLLKQGADPMLRSLENASAFTLSIYLGHQEVAHTLLRRETEASLNYVDCQGNTALSIAARWEWILLEHAIIARGGIIPGFKIKEGTTPSQMRVEFLKSLQQKGPLLADDSSISRAMLANCFVENKSADFPIDYLEYISLNPEFRRLMILVTHASNHGRSKHFFFEHRHNTALLFSKSSSGCFKHETKDTYCFYRDEMSIENIDTFFHEAMHLVMDLVYENTSNPYAREDSKKEQKFGDVLRETKTILDNLQSDRMSHLEQSSYSSLCSVYTAYLQNERAAELIARIPEILICMGIHRGMAWLSQFEALMTYYNTVVIPDMNNFILQHNCKNVAYEEKQVPLTPFNIIMQLIYERNFCFSIYKKDTKELRACEYITIDELKKIKKTALFFKYDSALLDTFEEHCKERIRYNETCKSHIQVEWAAKRSRLSVCELEQMTIELEKRRGDPDLVKSFKQYLENRKILDGFLLDPNSGEHLRYWSSQVTWFGGCDYNEHRVPHTVANILEMVERKSLIDISPGELLAEIHRLRKLDSGSKMSFFRSAAVQHLRTLPDQAFLLSFSPSNGCQGM